jgi:hypothetical protein
MPPASADELADEPDDAHMARRARSAPDDRDAAGKDQVKAVRTPQSRASRAGQENLVRDAQVGTWLVPDGLSRHRLPADLAESV